MCGIVGYIGKQDATEVIISGLEKLEYRGYDSAGVAILDKGEIKVTRAQGKLIELKNLLKNSKEKIVSGIGIGHTRWATHGKPSEENAHPHTAGRISIIHNGIIENYIELRAELTKKGAVFKSETDTETAAHLLNQFVNTGLDPFQALQKTCQEIRGSYAILAIDSQYDDRIVIAKNATPIVIGVGEGEVFVASDIPAVLPYTRKVIILEDGDLAEVKIDKITIINKGKPVERRIENITWDPVTAQKGGYKHYMLKEIHDQVEATSECMRGRIKSSDSRIDLSNITWPDDYCKKINRIVITACGTSWHASLAGKTLIEKYANIPCEVDYASEFRYRNPVLNDSTLVIAVSQSGETADTLAALEHANTKCKTLAICNVVGSSIARKADQVLYINAGPEISVASTKAFTTQVLVFFMFALWLGEKRQVGTIDQAKTSLSKIMQLPNAINQALALEKNISEIADKFYNSKGFFFIGRGLCFPIALEGALKLKEISYIHAEGYTAGELKHGPIALIDENIPVVVLLPKEEPYFEKTLSNLREVDARGGRIIAITDNSDLSALKDVSEFILQVPFVSNEITPLVMNVLLQLLAYYVAVKNGTDVDLPRNLAKSVTVE
jgi:glucosamine--fructose-6-phosphate aminotransferase (isomerizing)